MLLQYDVIYQEVLPEKNASFYFLWNAAFVDELRFHHQQRAQQQFNTDGAKLSDIFYPLVTLFKNVFKKT